MIKKYEIVIFVQSSQYFRNFLSKKKIMKLKKKKEEKKYDIIFGSMSNKACAIYRVKNLEKFEICT